MTDCIICLYETYSTDAERVAFLDAALAKLPIPVYGAVGQCSAPLCTARFSPTKPAYSVLGGGFVCESHAIPQCPVFVCDTHYADLALLSERLGDVL